MLLVGLIRLEDILKLSVKGRVAITTRKINFLDPGNVKEVLENLKLTEHQRIVVDCHYDRVYHVLKQVRGERERERERERGSW